MNPQQLYELWERQPWAAHAIDLGTDVEHWAALSDTERVRLTDEAVAQKEGISREEAKRRSTSLIPMGRYGAPAEFGALAAFVAGVPASYITGSMLRCDGGNIRSI